MLCFFRLNRTFTYIVLLPLVLYANRTGNFLLQSALSAIVFGDILTWIIFAVMDIPKNLTDSILNFLINAAVIICMIYFIEIDMSKTIEAEAVFFLAFLGTIGLKTARRMLSKINSET